MFRSVAGPVRQHVGNLLRWALGTAILLAAAAPGGFAQQPPPVNLALHLPLLGKEGRTKPGYVFEQPGSLAGSGVTDGIWWDHGASYFRDTDAMWIYPPPVNAVTFDLGSDQPLSEVRIHSLYRPRGSFPPESIVVLLSDDNVKYFYVTDISRSDAVFTKVHNFAADPNSSTHCFTVVYDAAGLDTHGRYVKFVLLPSPGDNVRMWIEEIEIFQGDPASLRTPLAGMAIVGSGMEIMGDLCWRRRLRLDGGLLAARAARAGLDLSHSLKDIGSRWRSFGDRYRETAHLKTYFPLAPLNPPGKQDSLGQIQHDLLRLNAGILRKEGYAGLVVWQSHSRWDPLDAYSDPREGRLLTRIDLGMMNGERRAVAVNLTNAADSDARVTVRIDGPAAAGRDPAWIDLYGIRGTDTRENVLQSDMLAPLAWGPGGYGLTVPAGATQQLWLRFAPLALAPGEKTALVLRISSGGVSHDIPVTLAISRYPFPSKLTLSFGDPWIGEVSVKLLKSTVGNINPRNVNVVNALLKDYQVDISGETLNVLTPGDAFRGTNFTNDTFTPPADFFRKIDRWITAGRGADFPETSLYMLTIDDRGDVGGVEWRTDPVRFAARVGSFAEVWERHLRRRGIDPQRVAFLYADEPNSPESQHNLIAWGTALRQGRSGPGGHVRLTSNASPDPATAVHMPFLTAKGPGNDVYTAADIPCPGWNAAMMFHARMFYKDLVRDGRALGICGGDFRTRSRDPYTNGVVMAWYEHDLGATVRIYNYLKYQVQGQRMNAYTDSYVPTPLYFAGGGNVWSSRAMESIFEGREDYQYLTIARSLIERLRRLEGDTAAVRRAAETVDRAVAAVLEQFLAPPPGDYTAWTTPKNRGVADAQRSVLFELIGELDAAIRAATPPRIGESISVAFRSAKVAAFAERKATKSEVTVSLIPSR